MVSDTLTEHDFGEQLLCAVFKFKGEYTLYWIYNFKQATFYPLPLKEKRGIRHMNSGCVLSWKKNCLLKKTWSDGILSGIFLFEFTILTLILFNSIFGCRTLFSR